MAGNILRKRIARKILLGYVVPLAVLLVAGLLVPILFWSYLGSDAAEYEESGHAADRVSALVRAAHDSQNALRGYVLYRDDTFRQQFQDAHDSFRDNARDCSFFLDIYPDTALKADLDAATVAYRQWRIRQALPLIRLTEASAGPRPAPEIVRDTRVEQGFARVDAAMNSLQKRIGATRADLGEKAKANNLLRLIILVTVPTTAVLLALLIVRSSTLGITRPLEALTAATEMLEEGEISRVLLDDDGDPADDEIGDLQKSFRRMARTIGQREAVLKAQNEAVAALNRRVEAVLNATNDAIIMLDRGGGFSVVNARFAQLFGIDAEVLLDHTFLQAGPLFLSRFQDRESVRHCFHNVLNDPDAICDETMEIIEPVHRVLRFYSAPVRGGEAGTDLLGRIFVFRDITRESAVDRMKTEFVSTVSHELRTPLTAIKGYVDLIVSGQTGPVPEIQQEFLNLVQLSTRRLSALINDMLDVSRIESGRITMRQESVAYVPLVEQTVRMMQNEAEQKQITLLVKTFGPTADNNHNHSEAELPPVIGDSDRITQVLVNLLSNGIKYTPPGGEVTVTVEYEDEFVTTCVADTGIGISHEDQTRLFQKFFRADNSTTREVGGTGLGLAITQAVLEKLNGSVWVESAPRKGSRFFFTLPTVHAHPSAETPAPQAESAEAAMVRQTAPSAPRKLVLSIDGDVSALRRLSIPLREGSFATSNAATESEARRRARALRPDLITLAPFSRGIDTFSLLRDLQADSTTRILPVALLLLRILGPQESEIESRIAFLPKPLEPQLLAKVAGPVVNSGTSHIPPLTVVLVIGPHPSVEMLRSCFSAPQTRIIHAENMAAASQEINSQSIALLLVDLSPESEPQAGADPITLLSVLYAQTELNRVPIVVLMDMAGAKPVLPLLPFGSPPVPLSGLNSYLKSFLSQEARLLSAVS